MRVQIVLLMVWTSFLVPAMAEKEIHGDASISKKIGGEEVVITTTNRLAGAIHSFRYRGREYIDSFDHGRQLQSAANFDGGKKFFPEVFNPTEAGSEADGRGPTSSSRLLQIKAGGGEISTSCQMAFWLKPGGKSNGNLAYNSTILSNHILHKHVRIGFEDIEQVLDYRVTFVMPKGEHHTYAQFEALTGYMPWDFQNFLRWESGQKKLVPLEKIQGEQRYPVVLATADGRHAMGIYAPAKFRGDCVGPGYGRFVFPEDKVVKWNAVFRIRNEKVVPPKEYGFRMFVPFGTVAEVEKTFATLMDRMER